MLEKYSQEKAWEITRGRISNAMRDYEHFLDTGCFPDTDVISEIKEGPFPISSSIGEIIFEPDFQRITAPNGQFGLTTTLTKILQRLIERSGEVQTHEQIYQAYRGSAGEISDNPKVQNFFCAELIRPMVSRLRHSLREVHPELSERIVNVRGKGYYWADDAEAERKNSKFST